MKFNVSSGVFSKESQRIMGIVGSNNVIPIIDNFLLKLEGNKLSITTTDMETFMTAYLEVQGIENGEICLSAKTLSDYLKAIPDQPILFEVGEQNSITIKRGKATQKFVGENAAEYPTIPEIENTESINLESDFLFSALTKVIRTVSAYDMRPSMTGVCFNIFKGQMDLVSTDAHRLTVITHKFDNEVESNFIVPSKPIRSILNNGDIAPEHITISYNKSNATLELGSLHISVRLIDQRYPDYKVVIQKDNPYTIKCSKSEIVNALRVAAISTNKDIPLIRFTPTKNELEIHSQDVDFGTESIENIGCEYDGKEITFGANSKQTLEMLASIESDEVVMKIESPSRAIIFHDQNNENFLGLVMPLMTI